MGDSLFREIENRSDTELQHEWNEPYVRSIFENIWFCIQYSQTSDRPKTNIRTGHRKTIIWYVVLMGFFMKKTIIFETNVEYEYEHLKIRKLTNPEFYCLIGQFFLV